MPAAHKETCQDYGQSGQGRKEAWCGDSTRHWQKKNKTRWDGHGPPGLPCSGVRESKRNTDLWGLSPTESDVDGCMGQERQSQHKFPRYYTY